MMSLETILGLAAMLFVIGIFGVLTKRNIIAVFMSLELMFNSVNLTFVALSYYVMPVNLVTDLSTAMTGHVFAIFVIAVAAAEVAVGLGIVFALYRVNGSIELTSDMERSN
tara:strand:- start:1322 stop:1654 length:333 start_codon:yes stop_codon:yes gene_type:complete